MPTWKSWREGGEVCPARETLAGAPVRRSAIPGASGVASVGFAATAAAHITRHQGEIDILHTMGGRHAAAAVRGADRYGIPALVKISRAGEWQDLKLLMDAPFGRRRRSIDPLEGVVHRSELERSRRACGSRRRAVEDLLCSKWRGHRTTPTSTPRRASALAIRTRVRGRGHHHLHGTLGAGEGRRHTGSRDETDPRRATHRPR